jgi:beta-1,4-mannosyltransferase
MDLAPVAEPSRPRSVEAIVPPLGLAGAESQPRSGGLEVRVIARPAFRDSTNPYCGLLYTHMMAAGGVRVEEYSWRRLLGGRHDICHLHWPELHLNQKNRALALRGSATALSFLRWARLRGTKIVWTIHNLHSHEQYYPRLERWFWDGFLRLVDGHISLSHSAHDAALARFPRLARIPGFIVPHGHYREHGREQITRAAARARLGLDADAMVVSFVGQIRTYKNVPQLIASFRALEDRRLVLLIAGEPHSPELADRVRAAAAGDSRVRLELEWLAEERLLLHLTAADLVVLPYREVLNSGSALLALSCDRPVLVPQTGSLAELQDVVSPAWLRTYSGELTPDHLRDAVLWGVTTPRPSQAPLETLRWDQIAGATLQAYRSLLARVSR